jgi:hypothetical protein
MKFHHALSLILFHHASAHRGHHHHHHGHDDHNHDHTDSNNLRRNLNVFDSPPGAAKGHCKGGEPTFTIGGVTYDCEADFNAKGGQCHTPDQTPEQAAVARADFEMWKEMKKGGNGKGKGGGTRGRRLSGCTGVDCAGFDAGKIITIPVHFHIFHDGTTGLKYTCTGSYDTGFQDGAGNCKYIQDQIKQVNKGFGGIPVDNGGNGYGQYHEDTQFQFCLASANNIAGATYNSKGAYNDRGSYKSSFRVGKMETFNVWVNKAGGYLGYATFPGSNFATDDGVVLLNDSMPGGDAGIYSEGDTLTHEIGHWLGLYHTFQGGCGSSTGDYQDLAPGGTRTLESGATYNCPIATAPDTCTEPGTIAGQFPDPIHNFMDYTQDSCMDEFTPGQAVRMKSAWELYRHCDDCDPLLTNSEVWAVAADGYSCVQGEPGSPAPSESSAPTDTLSAVPSPAPTISPPPTKAAGEVAVPLADWTVQSGTFASGTTGGQSALKSSGGQDNQCDRVRSPTLRLTSSSTLSISSYFDIEPKSRGTWYDRVNIALFDGTTRRIISPDGGRLYNVSGKTGGNFSCNLGELGAIGWGDSATTWAESTFSVTALGLNLSGDETAEVQIDIYYGTDESANGSGFSFNNVKVTNAQMV